MTHDELRAECRKILAQFAENMRGSLDKETYFQWGISDMERVFAKYLASKFGVDA